MFIFVKIIFCLVCLLLIQVWRMRRTDREQLAFGRRGNMAAGYAWFLVLGSVFLCNLMKTLLPSISSFVSVTSSVCEVFVFKVGVIVAN